MKKILKNRYFLFTMIYLCLLSVVAAGLSFSRYTSNDTHTDNSGVAVYDVVINSGDPSSKDTSVSMSVCATSKLSEPASMINGCYHKMQINVVNRSECTVALSDFRLTFAENSIYNKIIIPMNKSEMDSYEFESGSIPLAIIDYLGMTQEEISNMTVEQVNAAVSNSNEQSCAYLSEHSVKLNKGEAKTFFVVAWVEHDSVYKQDADLNADKISHLTPTELGILPETFNFSVHSEQVD